MHWFFTCDSILDTHHHEPLHVWVRLGLWSVPALVRHLRPWLPGFFQESIIRFVLRYSTTAFMAQDNVIGTVAIPFFHLIGNCGTLVLLSWEQPPRGVPWVSGLVRHFVQTWSDSECSHTVQFLDCSDWNWCCNHYYPFWHCMTLLVLMCR